MSSMWIQEVLKLGVFGARLGNKQGVRLTKQKGVFWRSAPHADSLPNGLYSSVKKKTFPSTPTMVQMQQDR